MPETPATVRIVTLGCAKNDVDSEEIAGVLQEAGCRIEGGEGRVDVVVVNTCGFLESAKAESIQAIRRAVREKKAGRVGKVVVAGCLAQRLGADLARLAPGADTYVGVGQMGRFDEIVADTLARRGQHVETRPPQHLWAEVGTRARAGKPWSAYLKVSEGCDHKCTFCTIPSFRGPHVSKPIERVIAEARTLAERGVREINLIGQDVTQYGFDLYRAFTLPKLLRELDRVDGLEWIRILYFYPNRLTPEVIETMAACSKVVPYIDIPLQHAHPDTLRRMKRPWDGDRYLEVFGRLRSALPDCAIRTTFIVGFPGETEAEFEHLLAFVREARLDRVGAFPYSREPGTPSHDLPGQVSTKVKNDRYNRLMRVQQGISLEANRAWIGRTLRVLVDEERDGWCLGRSHRDAPEIDGMVVFAGAGRLGTFADVGIERAEPYDLYGSAVGEAPGKGRLPLRALRLADPVQPR